MTSYHGDDVTGQLPPSVSFAQSLEKRESLAEQCPTIQNLLRQSSAQTQSTRLPGIQQIFNQHAKPPPPPPYPNHDYSCYTSTSPASPLHSSIPRAPRQLNQSPSLNMLNADSVCSPTLAKDPFLRPTSRKGSEIASPCSELAQMMTLPRSPRSTTVVSPAPSTCSEMGFGHLLWEEDGERKPVLTQWQNTDSETLFMELSSSVLSQI